jgi:hypothetical protein
MNVKKLKEIMAAVPPEYDELQVLLQVEDHLHPGMFAFKEACECDTGVMELAPENHEDPNDFPRMAFLILPHGTGLPEEEIETGNTVGLN